MKFKIKSNIGKKLFLSTILVSTLFINEYAKADSTE